MKRKGFPYKTYGLLIAGLLVLFIYQLFTLKNEYEREKGFLAEDIRQALMLADYSELTLRQDSLDSRAGTEDISITAFMDKLGYLGIGISIRPIDITKPALAYYSRTPRPVDRKNMADYEEINRLTMLSIHSSLDHLAPIYYNLIDTLLCMSFKESHIQPDYRLSLVQMAKGDSIMQGNILKTSHILDTKAAPLISRRHMGGDKAVNTFRLEDMKYNAPFWQNKEASAYLYSFDLGRQNAYLLEIGNMPEMIFSKIINIIIFSFITFVVIVCLITLLIRKNLRLTELKERETKMMQNMTHELKTPIAVSMAAVEALSDEEFPLPEDKRKKYYGILKDKLDELSNRISRILHPIKLQQRLTAGGRIKLKAIPTINLLDTVQPLLKDIFLQTGGKANVQVNIPSDATIPMRKEDLRRILANLLDNAIKYSPTPPAISIKAYEKGKRWIVKVEDRGYGIPKREQRRIFDRFYRVENGHTQTARGTGVGLNDVRETITAYHGKVSVKSEVGKGSCFTLIFKTV